MSEDPLNRVPCIICSRREPVYLFSLADAKFERCSGCGLVRTCGAKKSNSISIWSDPATEHDAALNYLVHVQAVCPHGRILVICSERHALVHQLQRHGYDTVFLKPEEFLEQKFSFAHETFDAAFLLYALEKQESPESLLADVNTCLVSGGALFIVTPALDSRSARLFGRGWIQWRMPNRLFFSRSTLQLLLEKHGFFKIWVSPDRRPYSLNHVLQRMAELNWLLVRSFCLRSQRWLPEKLRSAKLFLNSSGVIATSFKRKQLSRPLLSIIMPVYNEKNTVATAIRAVLAKQLNGVRERELIIVESNSTDGSRAIVDEFAACPGVKVMHQDKPKGKGYAVREGMKQADGDIIMIQDADLEYDINDYDELLAPLLRYEKTFVLGSRHQGDWKMRKFTDRPHLALLFNLGQIFFTFLMNFLYGQKMTDPFTMYKVLRRECLYGLNFECNRFDFDHELVIKLVRKGYTPYEIPVNYCSRSYSEGKKVTILGDPPLWIKANLKFRFSNPFLPFAQALAQARLELSAENRGQSGIAVSTLPIDCRPPADEQILQELPSVRTIESSGSTTEHLPNLQVSSFTGGGG